MAIFVALLALGWQGGLVTPYASHSEIAISADELPPQTPKYGVEEIGLKVGGTYDNPFDPADIAVDAAVTTPSGKTYSIPAYFEREFSRSLNGDQETLKASEPGGWKLRVCPTEVGAYKLNITAKDRSGTASVAATFQSTASDAPGSVRVSPRNRRSFEFANGKSYWPLGANIGWGSSRGTYDFDKWLPAYAAAGCNYGRLWLSPEGMTFALERPGKSEDGKGMGQFDLGNAWKVDYVLKQAQKDGIQLMLTIDSYNILRNLDGYPSWEKTPHNRENGGPLRIWTDFWTDAKMDKFYKDKLRYLVARYSAFSNVMAWEFWNEVDITRDFNVDTVRTWHQRMGDTLRALDPYGHLLTTSMGDSMGERSLLLLNQLDFVQTHHYGSDDLAGTVAYQESRKASWGKPHFFGEIGADASGPRAGDDPKGLQIHDPIWMSLATGASGSAMPWWWDSYIDPLNLYHLFGAVHRFIDGIDFPSEQFGQTDVGLAYQNTPRTQRRLDLEISGGPSSWSAAEFNRPAHVRYRDGLVSGNMPLAGLMHGVKNHPDLHNPVAFELSLPRATKFEVEVGDVSGYGGATLRIKLDGEKVAEKDFADPDGATSGTTLTKYAGTYGVTVPAGRHTVTVENVGADWFFVSYRLVGVRSSSSPPIQAWGALGNDTVIVWMRPEGRTWRAVSVAKKSFPPVPPAVLGLKGLPAGIWRAEYWDTWAGKVMSSRTVRVPNSGKVRVPTPSFSTDLAVKMVKVQ